MLRLLLWGLVFSTVRACIINGFDITTYFSNTFELATLTIIETYDFIGTDCTYTITASQIVIDGNSTFHAIPQTLSSEPISITVTYQYPNLTLTALETLSPTIYWVETWLGGDGGGGEQTIVLPFVPTKTSALPTTSTHPMITSTPTLPPPSTLTVTATYIPTASPASDSSAPTRGEIGGIIGGVLAGMFILTAFIIYLLHRRNQPPRPMVYTPNMRYSQNSLDAELNRQSVLDMPKRWLWWYREERGQTGARVRGF